MTKRSRFLLLAAAALLMLLAIVSRRTPIEQKPQAATTNTFAVIALGPTNEAVASSSAEGKTTRLSVPPALVSELNRFITLARPYGLDAPITPDDVTHLTNEFKGRVLLETKTHLADFRTRGHATPQLHHFLATYDMSNPVATPELKREAMSKWYQATGKWSPEEALAETYLIMERLGIRATWDDQEARPATITVRNPQGESVQVTPFYNVTLRGSKGTIMAEFRMGQAGPGRLTEWYANLKPDAQ